MPRGKKAKVTDEVKQEKTTVEASASDTPAPAPKKEKKTAAKKKEKVVAEAIIVQSGGLEWDVNEIKEKVIAAYVAEGHRRGRISEFTMYLKPEDKKAYYVINGKIKGNVDI